jgi:hypothetical protein
MLVGSQLRHWHVTLSAATVTFDQNADDNQQEGQAASDCKADQDYKAKGKMVGYRLSAYVHL